MLAFQEVELFKIKFPANLFSGKVQYLAHRELGIGGIFLEDIRAGEHSRVPKVRVQITFHSHILALSLNFLKIALNCGQFILLLGYEIIPSESKQLRWSVLLPLSPLSLPMITLTMKGLGVQGWYICRSPCFTVLIPSPAQCLINTCTKAF